MPWFILPFTDIYCIILKISHLISCCNESKLLFSIFTLVKVKERSKMIDVIKVCRKSHPISPTRGGGLFISSTFDEGGRLIEEEGFVGRGGFIFNLQQNGRRSFVVQCFDEWHELYSTFLNTSSSLIWPKACEYCLPICAWIGIEKKNHWSIIKSSIYFFGWEGKGGQEGAYFCVALLNKLKAF